MDALAPFLEPIDIPLAHLFLDPNNPRFVGSDWTFIPDDIAVSAEAQQEAANRLMAHHDVKKLQLVIEANGFLPIDRVVVRRGDYKKYIVLEGNRRICAAKQINGHSDAGETLAPDIMATLTSIPCLEYTGAEDKNEVAWIFQGLRHISGISEWPAFNKAKLLVDEMDRGGLSFTDVGKRFGLSPFGAAQWVRGFYAFRQAKNETEYGNYIDERMYPYFQEIFGRSSISLKDWLNWDDAKKEFLDQANLNEFVSWFFPVEQESSEEESGPEKEPTAAELSGAWNRRRVSKRDDLRHLSYLITKAPKEWMEFRSGADIESVYSRAILIELEKSFEDEKDIAERLFKYVDETLKLIQNTPFSVLSSEERRSNLFEKLDAIHAVHDGLKKLTNA